MHVVIPCGLTMWSCHVCALTMWSYHVVYHVVSVAGGSKAVACLLQVLA